ncbi:MAG: pilus assembly protein PilM, partial [Minisyncoccales bacterium]
NGKENFVIVDIGAKTTTVNVVHNDNLTLSHSIDVGGDSLSEILVEKLGFDFNEAEKSKRQYGVKKEKKNIRQSLLYEIDKILAEIEQISKEFTQKQGVEPEEVILAGAAGQMPGLIEYAKDYLGKKVKTSNPFSNISYPSILEEKLKEIGPSYSIAVGSALKKIIQNGN